MKGTATDKKAGKCKTARNKVQTDCPSGRRNIARETHAIQQLSLGEDTCSKFREPFLSNCLQILFHSKSFSHHSFVLLIVLCFMKMFLFLCSGKARFQGCSWTVYWWPASESLRHLYLLTWLLSDLFCGCLFVPLSSSSSSHWQPWFRVHFATFCSDQSFFLCKSTSN